MNYDIAIVGIVCNVPGASNAKAFWQLLKFGREGLRAPIKKAPSSANNYVHRGGFIEHIADFAANYFNYTPTEAAFMDPQHRLWLQACWQALEVSGNADTTNKSVGVYATASHNSYLHYLLQHHLINEQQAQAALLGNAADCLATRVSYALNLTGPSMTIQSGCSSSLVCVHQARLALLAKQCDLALAGGISIRVPDEEGYIASEDSFLAKDGYCRPFSSDASGTVFSSGYGVVVLKRLTDAIKDGDKIYAVIKGSAINNDGNDKASFTAPSINGQSQVIQKALRVAQVKPEQIYYIEGHGTATKLGDPIEVAALATVFSKTTQPYLGSVKGNIGHLDVAAGIIGLIKVCLALEQKQLPPQINFTMLNEKIKHRQFQINTTLQPITATECIYAGVSSFGFGGSNAHVVVSEAPALQNNTAQPLPQAEIILLSAKTNTALLEYLNVLSAYLVDHSNLSLSDVSYTLQVGRRSFPYRLLLKVRSIPDLIQQLDRVLAEDIVYCPKQSTQQAPSTQADSQWERLWLTGAILPWQDLWSAGSVKKVELPSSILETQHYWLDASASEKKFALTRHPDIKHWLYEITWRQVSQAKPQKQVIPYLLICTAFHPLANAQMDKERLCLEFADDYQEKTTRHLTANPISHQQQIIDWLAKQQEIPKQSIFLLPENIVSVADCEQHINNLLTLLKNKGLLTRLNKLLFVIYNAHAITEQAVNPLASLFVAFSRAISQEFPTLTVQCIDLLTNESKERQWQAITNTMQSDLSDLSVWRGGKCWQADYTPINFPTLEQAPGYFQAKGIYLITGGLGNVASVHVNFLCKHYQAHVILLGRSTLPSEAHWLTLINNPTTDAALKTKLQRLTTWRAQGYDFSYHVVDITDQAAMSRLCQTIIQQFGVIDGIIHIAGVGSDMHYKLLTELDWQHCQHLFTPKLAGLSVIQHLMHAFTIPKGLVISSISAALAGMGLSAYAAVHNMLDALIINQYPKLKLINWDAWNFHLNDSNATTTTLGAELNKLAITPAEGELVLKHAFSLSDWQQLFISSADLSQRIQAWTKRKVKVTTITAHHSRPKLASEYIEANTELEKALITIWQSVLGVAPIGIHDNFFELGGHSLLLLDLITAINAALNHQLTAVTIFEAPTIQALAKKIQPEPNKLAATQSRVALQRQAISKRIALHKQKVQRS